ncbi:hypothetical protein CAEBREN_18078 [Caenorhabditis brenneri]|uniref:Uncharacterized protein n=1 Tax=Caenorhabditis brenneri TaxID=135651 RepID=G0MME9_CAEBE|nr:hypothetical protein CAEBREN_18078 [Caenorhabditis brenneri]
MTSQEIAEITAKYALQEEPYVDMPFSKFHTMLKDVNDELMKTMSEDVINLSEDLVYLEKLKNMAQGLGYNPYFHAEEDDHDLGFRRYHEDVEHSQNLVIHDFEDDSQDPTQAEANHKEVPHEEHQLVAREESPVPQTFFQYEDLGQWDYEEENQTETQESPHQQESSKQNQQSEDQDYQVEYPQYQDKEFHQQMPHVVHQQDFLEYKDLDQLEYDKGNRFDYQQLAHQQQPPQQIEHSAQVNYQLEYSVTNKGNQMDSRQERQMVRQQRPTQSHQMRPEQVCPKEHQVEDLPIQQARPQKQRVQRDQPVNLQDKINLFGAPQPQVQRTGPLCKLKFYSTPLIPPFPVFSPLEHPLNRISKLNHQQRNQKFCEPGPPQHSQLMKQPTIGRVSGTSHQFEHQLAQQDRPQQKKVARVQPVNSQSAYSEHEMASFSQSPLRNKEPNFQGQGTSPLVFSPLQHPLNGVSKWKPVYLHASLQNKAPNVQEQRSTPLRFSPMVHPITKAPVVINQQVSQQTHHQGAVHPTQRVEEMEKPSQITENPRTRWHRLTQEEKKRSNIKRTENRQKKRIRDAQKAQEEKEKQANDALKKLHHLNSIWPL